MLKKENKNLFFSASILGIGAFIAKLLGAIYRVPLTAILKSEGIGIYQMVFPVYALLLDFSGAGVPNALSKLIAENKENKERYAKKYLVSSIKLFGIIGLICSFLMLVCSGIIAKAQGNKLASLSYVTLAPSVFFVCLISCYRGGFQGLGKMKPTAFSQVIEQVVKVILGIILAKIFSYELKKSVAGATLAVTISEVVAFFVLFFVWNKKINRNIAFNTFNVKSIKINYKRLIKVVIPITLVGIILPFSQVVDSFLIINLLKQTSNATALFGLFSGVCLTIINLPVSVCYGIGVASVPEISSLENKYERNDKITYIISLTFIVALIFSILVFIFSKLSVNILFSSLNSQDKAIAIRLIKICSPIIILLSLVQTQNSVLIACGSYYAPVFSLSVGVLIKTILEIFLIKNPTINIFGGAVSLIACYFVVYLLNFILIKRIGDKDAVKTHQNRKLNNKKQRLSCTDGGLH